MEKKEMKDVEETIAEQALEELQGYEGDNVWQDIFLGHGIDNGLQDANDPDGSYSVYFQDDSILEYRPDRIDNIKGWVVP